jgi:hypothetical protein
MIRFYSLFEPFRKAFSFCINKINNNNALALLIIFLCTIFIKLYFIQLGTITTDEGYYLSYSLNLKEALFYTPRDYNFYYTKESRILYPIQIGIIASVLRPDEPNLPIQIDNQLRNYR